MPSDTWGASVTPPSQQPQVRSFLQADILDQPVCTTLRHYAGPDASRLHAAFATARTACSEVLKYAWLTLDALAPFAATDYVVRRRPNEVVEILAKSATVWPHNPEVAGRPIAQGTEKSHPGWIKPGDRATRVVHTGCSPPSLYAWWAYESRTALSENELCRLGDPLL